MRLLAIDPSSVAIGWASFDGGKLKHAGVMNAIHGNLIKRMNTLDNVLIDLLDTLQPNRVVMEMHEGFPFARNQESEDKKRSAKVAATLCHAQGWILGTIDCFFNLDMIDIVGDLTWTNRKSKISHGHEIRAMFPDFASVWEQDKGYDATDAVGIGLYWLQDQTTKQLMEGAKSLKTKLPGVD